MLQFHITNGKTTWDERERERERERILTRCALDSSNIDIVLKERYERERERASVVP